MFLQNIVWDGSLSIIKLFARAPTDCDFDNAVTDLCDVLKNVGNPEGTDDLNLLPSVISVRKVGNIQVAEGHPLLEMCTSRD